MGSTTTEQKTIPGAGAAESNLMNLLMRIAQAGEGQMGNLGALARGETGGPTAQDEALVNASIMRAREMAQRELEQYTPELSAQISEQMAQRGIEGSSSEVVARGLLGRNMQSQLAQALLQAQQQGGEALMNLPFRRAEVALNANQALFNRIIGAAAPVLSSQLQSRLAQTTTTMKQPLGPEQIMEMAKTGGALIAAPFTGGASLALLAG